MIWKLERMLQRSWTTDTLRSEMSMECVTFISPLEINESISSRVILVVIWILCICHSMVVTDEHLEVEPSGTDYIWFRSAWSVLPFRPHWSHNSLQLFRWISTCAGRGLETSSAMTLVVNHWHDAFWVQDIISILYVKNRIFVTRYWRMSPVGSCVQSNFSSRGFWSHRMRESVEYFIKFRPHILSLCVFCACPEQPCKAPWSYEKNSLKTIHNCSKTIKLTLKLSQNSYLFWTCNMKCLVKNEK